MSIDLTQNLKLHFTFGSETLNITKDAYLIMNRVDFNYNGIISEPLCLDSTDSKIGDLSFRCNQNTLPPQIGTFTLPNPAIGNFIINNGKLLSFWLKTFDALPTELEIVNFKIDDSFNVLLSYDNINMYAKINDNINIIGTYSKNAWYHIILFHNNLTNDFQLLINNVEIILNTSYKSTNSNYELINFGHLIKPGFININDIRLYDSLLNKNLISELYNNSNGVYVKPYIPDFNVNLVNNVIGVDDVGEIIFTPIFKRLPLLYNLKIKCIGTKSTNEILVSHYKSLIDKSSCLKSSLGNNNTFSQDTINIIYVPSIENDFIHINFSNIGIKILNLEDLDNTILSTIGIQSELCVDNFKFNKLKTNLYNYLNIPISNTPDNINNFLDLDTSPACNIQFNGVVTNKIFKIYFYKFNDSQSIYYYLDEINFNSFENLKLPKLVKDIYKISAELSSKNNEILKSPEITLIIANEQPPIKIIGPLQMNIGDYGSIKVLQDFVFDAVTKKGFDTQKTKLIINIKLSTDTKYTQIILTNDTYIFTPNNLGIYNIFVIRDGSEIGYEKVFSNTISINVLLGSQLPILLGGPFSVTFPLPIKLEIDVLKKNISQDTKQLLFYKHNNDETFSNTELKSTNINFDVNKSGIYTFYVNFTNPNYIDISSNILNVTVLPGIQPPINFSLDKLNIKVNENIGILINKIDILKNSNLMLQVNYNTLPANLNSVSYRYYRFAPQKLRNNTQNLIQIAELIILLNDQRVDYSLAKAINLDPNNNVVFDNPQNQTPLQGIDNNIYTKWLDLHKGSLIIDFGKEIEMNKYSFITANDAPERDPISWIFYGSKDFYNWETLDIKENFNTPNDRYRQVENFFVTIDIPHPQKWLDTNISIIYDSYMYYKIINAGISYLRIVNISPNYIKYTSPVQRIIVSKLDQPLIELEYVQDTNNIIANIDDLNFNKNIIAWYDPNYSKIQSNFIVSGVNSGNAIYFADLNIQSNPNWTQIPGALKQISISNNKLYGANGGNDVFYCANYKSNGAWVYISGIKLIQVALDGINNIVVGVNSENNIFYANTNIESTPNWTQMPGSLSNITIAKGKLYGVNSGNDIFYCDNYKIGNWIHLPGGKLKQIFADENGTILVGVNSSNNIFYADTNINSNPNWTLIPGSLKNVSISKGVLYGVNSNDDIFYCANYKNGGIWVQVPGKLMQVSISSTDIIMEVPNRIDTYPNLKLQAQGQLSLYNYSPELKMLNYENYNSFLTSGNNKEKITAIAFVAYYKINPTNFDMIFAPDTDLSFRRGRASGGMDGNDIQNGPGGKVIINGFTHYDHNSNINNPWIHQNTCCIISIAISPKYNYFLGVGTDNKLYKKDSLISPWVFGGDNTCCIKAVHILANETILGVGMGGNLYTKIKLADTWVDAGSGCCVIDVTENLDGTLIGVGTDNKLYTKKTLSSPWIYGGDNTCCIKAVHVLLDGRIIGVGTDSKLYTKLNLTTNWVYEGDNTCCVKDITQRYDGTIIGIGTDNILYYKENLKSNWVSAGDNTQKYQIFYVKFSDRTSHFGGQNFKDYPISVILGSTFYNRNFIGYIGDFICFNANHTVDDQIFIEGFLASKYNLQKQLPLNHKYYNMGPSQIINPIKTIVNPKKYKITTNIINIPYRNQISLFLKSSFLSNIKYTLSNYNCTVLPIIKDTSDNLLPYPSIIIFGKFFGTTTINIIKEGEANYLDNNIEIIINVIKLEQPNILLNIDGLVTNNDNVYILDIKTIKSFPLVLYNIKDNPTITWFISNTNICSITNNTLNILKNGSCSINAILSETLNYLESTSNIINITTGKLNQQPLTYESLNKLYYNDYIFANVKGDNSIKTEMQYNSLTPNLCTTFGNQITAVNVENDNKCMVEVIKIGNELYDNTSTTLTIPIFKIEQPETYITIDRGTITGKDIYNINVDPTNSYTLILNNSKEVDHNNIIYELININSNNTICKIEKNKIFGLLSGTCQIQAIIPETKSYKLSKSSILTVNITRNSQSSLSIGSIEPLYYANTINIPFSGGNSIGDIKITSDSSNCQVNNSQITGFNNGPCNINITKGSDFMYLPISNNLKLNVLKIKQSIQTINIEGINVDISNNATIYIDKNKKYKLLIPGTFENPKISFQISSNYSLEPNNPVCIITDKNELIANSEGVCLLTGYTDETPNYLKSNTPFVLIKIEKNKQNKLNFGTINYVNYKQSLNLNVTGGSVSEPVTLISDSSNCSINNSNVIGNNYGTCNITASKSGNNMYLSISDTVNLNVLKINQSNLKIIIPGAEQDNLGNVIIKVDRNKKYELTISGAFENPNYIFNVINTSSTNYDICKIDKNIIIPYSGGTCLIEGICNETANYLQTNAPSILVRVVRTEQNDLNLYNDIAPPIYYNNQTYLDISGGNTDAQININTDSSNCKIIDNNILGITPGNCNINVVKPGDYFYYDKTKQFNFEVLKIIQPPIHITIENKEYDYLSTHTEPSDFRSNILELKNLTGKDSYKNGIYTVEASTFTIGNEPYIGFTTINSGWQSTKSTYDNLGTYLGKFKTKINGIGDVFGEWLQITLPYSIKLTKYKLINTTLEGGKFCPKLYYIVGSNDNIIWYNIDYKNLTNIPTPSDVSTYDVLNNNLYFNTYRIVVNKNFGSNSVILNQFDFVGIYSDMSYTLTVDRNINYKVILNNIQDNAQYKLSITSNYSIDPDTPVIKINSDNTITPYSSGVCLLIAKINSTNNYNTSNTIPLIITVNKKEQEAMIKGIIPPLYYNSTVNIDISGSTATNNIYLTSNTLENCTVSGYTLIGKKAGKCQITATKPGNDLYATQSLQIDLQVNKLIQPKMFITIKEVNETITDNITLYVDRNKRYKLNLVGYLEDPSISYSVISNYSLEPSQEVCQINSNNELIAFNLGVCLLRANVSETNNYLYGQSEPIVVSVFRNKQNELSYKANQLIYTNKINLDISGGSNLNQVQLTVNNDSKTNCSISSNEVTGLYTGKCNINAVKQGDYNYDDTQLTIPLVVNKKNQPSLVISLAPSARVSQEAQLFRETQLLRDAQLSRESQLLRDAQLLREAQFSSEAQQYALEQYIENKKYSSLFNGSTQYAKLSEKTDYLYTVGTVEVWIKTSNAGASYRAVITKQGAYGFFLLDNKLIIFDWNVGPINTNISLNDNKWHSIIFSFNSGVANGSKIYIDGILIKTFTYSIYYQEFPLIIGSSSNPGTDSSNTGQNFNGYISNLRIWDIILSDSFISNNYNKIVDKNTPGLTGYWKLNDSTGSIFKNLIKGRPNFTIYNSVTLAPEVPPIITVQ
jgi:hypothetical protein